MEACFIAYALGAGWTLAQCQRVDRIAPLHGLRFAWYVPMVLLWPLTLMLSWLRNQ